MVATLSLAVPEAAQFCRQIARSGDASELRPGGDEGTPDSRRNPARRDNRPAGSRTRNTPTLTHWWHLQPPSGQRPLRGRRSSDGVAVQVPLPDVDVNFRQSTQSQRRLKTALMVLQLASTVTLVSCGGSGASNAANSHKSGPGDSIRPEEVCQPPTPWTVPTSATIIGTGTADSCTATALTDAVGLGGSVTFNCGNSPVTIPILNAITVRKETVIDGGLLVTLDGGNANQIFLVSSNNSLSVRNLRFINGKSPNTDADASGIGGAVAGNWRSKIEVIGCTFEDNTAGRGGGAVSVWTGSSLTVVSSRFLRNHSHYGGAIYSLLSPLTVINCDFEDNSTTTDTGVGDGGAIGTDGASESPDDAIGGDVVICGSRIAKSQGYGNGGGAYIWVYPPDRVVVERTTVEGNTVSKNSKGSGGLGAAMRISNGDITVDRSSLLSNTSDNDGGAFYLDCAPSCTITNSTFYGNAAKAYGGAIFGDNYKVNNVTFANNTAGGHGGALFGKNFELHNSIFLDNSSGNPWNQAMNCSSTGTGDHVLQWQSATSNGGADTCIATPTIGDPKLSTPADNGGGTYTMLPGSDSAALRKGTECELTDQRGETRDATTCDLGSVELTSP